MFKGSEHRGYQAPLWISSVRTAQGHYGFQVSSMDFKRSISISLKSSSTTTSILQEIDEYTIRFGLLKCCNSPFRKDSDRK